MKKVVETQPELLRPEEVARVLAVARSTVFELLRAGELPAVRIGRAVRIPSEGPGPLDRGSDGSPAQALGARTEGRVMAGRRSNGEGSFVQRPDGAWVAAVRLPNGERKWVYGRTRKEAAARLSEAIEDASEGLRPVSGRVTVAELLDEWLTQGARSTVRPSTYRSYSDIVRLHLVPELGRLRLVKLEPFHVERMLRRKLDAGLSPRRVQYIHAVLRRALGRAVRWGWIRRNVATLVDPPRVRRPEIEPLSPSEIGQLFDALEGERLRALYVLAVSTGLRQGELLGLRWGDVDLVGGRITVARALQRVDGVATFVEPNSARSWRTVPPPGLAAAALEAHYLSRKASAGELARAGGVGVD